MALFEITGWRAALFWSVNIPRYFLGMDLVVYRCMIGCPVIDGFKRVTKGVDMAKQNKTAEVFTRALLFGAVRYSTSGAVSLVELFDWAVYKRVGTVRQIAGITFGRNKAGE